MAPCWAELSQIIGPKGERYRINYPWRLRNAVTVSSCRLRKFNNHCWSVRINSTDWPLVGPLPQTGLNSRSSAPTGCAFPLKKQLCSPSQGSSPDDDDFNLCSVRHNVRFGPALRPLRHPTFRQSSPRCHHWWWPWKLEFLLRWLRWAGWPSRQCCSSASGDLHQPQPHWWCLPGLLWRGLARQSGSTGRDLRCRPSRRAWAAESLYQSPCRRWQTAGGQVPVLSSCGGPGGAGCGEAWASDHRIRQRQALGPFRRWQAGGGLRQLQRQGLCGRLRPAWPGRNQGRWPAADQGDPSTVG